MISAAKIAHNRHARASHALTRHACGFLATPRITRISATPRSPRSPARLIASPRSPARLIASPRSPARLGAGTPHALHLTPHALHLTPCTGHPGTGTPTRSPGISALRPGLPRRYVHLAALSPCDLCLTALSHAVILRICTGSQRFRAIACTRSLCRFPAAWIPRPPRPPFAPAPVGIAYAIRAKLSATMRAQIEAISETDWQPLYDKQGKRVCGQDTVHL